LDAHGAVEHNEADWMQKTVNPIGRPVRAAVATKWRSRELIRNTAVCRLRIGRRKGRALRPLRGGDGEFTSP